MSITIRKKVKGENRVKKIISARVLGGIAAMMLVVASIVGFNQQTDTAQAASTGSINLVNNWSKLSTATSPSKLATLYGATTPSYVGSGKSLYATYTSTGRHVQSKSNQLVIEVVDADLNAAVVKSTLIILKGGHSSSSTVITNFQANTSVASNSTKEYAIPIIDTDGVAGISGADLTFACRWIGEGFEDTDGSSGDTILRATADVLLDGTVIDTPTVTLANAVAATAAHNEHGQEGQRKKCEPTMTGQVRKLQQQRLTLSGTASKARTVLIEPHRAGKTDAQRRVAAAH